AAAPATRARPPGLLVRFVAEMLGQLGRRRPLHQPLRQLREHAIGPDDLLFGAGAGEQLVDHLVRETVAKRVRDLERLAAARSLRSPSGLAPRPAGAIDQIASGLGLPRHDAPFRSCLLRGSDTPGAGGADARLSLPAVVACVRAARRVSRL